LQPSQQLLSDDLWRLYKSYDEPPQNGRVLLATVDNTVREFKVAEIFLRLDDPWEIAASVLPGSVARGAIGLVDAWLNSACQGYSAEAAAATSLQMVHFAEFILNVIVVSNVPLVVLLALVALFGSVCVCVTRWTRRLM
jgi:hypothetical protein